MANPVNQRIVDPWGTRQPHPRGREWPERVDEAVSDEPDRWVQSCCVLCSNGCGLDIGVKDGRIVGVRGRGDRPRQPRPARARRACTAGRRTTAPTGSPGRWSATAAELREATWDEAMEPRRRTLPRDDARESRPRRGRLLQHRPAVPGGVLHALARRPRRVGTNHLDGNTRLCTATAAQALRETFGCRRPAVLLHRRRRDRRAVPRRQQHGRDADRALDARPRPAAPARSRRSWSSSTRAGPRPRAKADVHLPPAAGHERRPAERHAPPADRGRARRPRVRRRAHRRLRPPRARRCEPTRPSGSRRSPASRPRDLARGRANHRHGGDARVVRAPGRVPVATRRPRPPAR